MTSTAFDRACEGCGGSTAMARGLSVGVQVVSNWRARQVPLSYCPAIEQMSGVPCEELRDDVSWHRVPDPSWPNGKPLLDPASPKAEPLSPATPEKVGA